MTPCQQLLKQEGTARYGCMQQSSATPSLHLWFLGVVEDCCMLSILLAVPSCFNSFWHGVIPTFYFIFNDFDTCTYMMDQSACEITQQTCLRKTVGCLRWDLKSQCTSWFIISMYKTLWVPDRLYIHSCAPSYKA